MKLLEPIHRFFETWIDPFGKDGELRPPAVTLRFFWFYLKQAKLAFLALVALGGLVALVEAALFYYVGRLIDMMTALPAGEGWDALIAANGHELATMLVVTLGFRFLIAWLSATVEEQTIALGFYSMVRWQAYAHVIRQNLTFFQNDFAGAIASKVWQAGAAVGDFMVSLLQVVWNIVIFVVATTVILGQLDWRLAVAMIVWVAVFAICARYFVPRMRKAAAATAELGSSLTGKIVDSFANIQMLKLFGTAEGDDRFVRRGFNDYLAAQQKLARTLVGVRSSMAMLSGVAITGITALSVHLWAEGVITVGAVALTTGVVLRLYAMLGRLMNQLNGMMRNYGTAQNSAEIISKPIGLVDAPYAQPLVVRQAAVTFDHITFRYEKSAQPVIDDLSLSIKPGERIGLIGRSGAGKSTLVNLLLRFYDVKGGAISIDGQDISRVTQESLRRQIGVVTQDTALLHRSLRANLTYGRPDATDEEMMNAAAMAEADEFIEALVDQRGRSGYDAYVGERGVKLSGGQRQRVAIARVLLKDAPILVLDEATSALDSEVEAAIQSQLKTLMAGKTVIAIAHRLSTIAEMDRLIVLDRGRIIEEGTHLQLLSLGGVYAGLWARQSGGFLDAEAAE